MSSYCSPGDKPKVYFNFKNSPQEIYESQESPIEVSLENYSVSGENYSPTGYQVNFYSPNNGVGLSRTVRAYKIIDLGIGHSADSRYVFAEIGCNGTSFKEITNIDPSSLTINTSVTCPTVSHDTLKSRLHVKKQGETVDIFSAEGDYPGNFSVGCADCPPGTCRCKNDNYPGYCCLDYNVIASEIHSITQSLKTKNNGRHLLKPSGGNSSTTV